MSSTTLLDASDPDGNCNGELLFPRKTSAKSRMTDRDTKLFRGLPFSGGAVLRLAVRRLSYALKQRYDVIRRAGDVSAMVQSPDGAAVPPCPDRVMGRGADTCADDVQGAAFRVCSP